MVERARASSSRWHCHDGHADVEHMLQGTAERVVDEQGSAAIVRVDLAIKSASPGRFSTSRHASASDAQMGKQDRACKLSRSSKFTSMMVIAEQAGQSAKRQFLRHHLQKADLRPTILA